MGLSIVTPATVMPVTTDEIKTACRIEDSSFDSEIALLLPAAVAYVASWIDKPVAPTGYRLTLDEFSDAIELPIGPVTAVASVKYYDAAAVLQTVSPASYSLDLTSEPQWVVRNLAYDWPVPLDGINMVTVDFTAGYTTTTLPADLKLAILGVARIWFEGGMGCAIPDTLHATMEAYRVSWIAA